MNNDIRIIFIDIDWTILSHSKKPPRIDKKSIRYLNKLHKRGVKIVLSTARPYHSVMDTRIPKYLKFDGLILATGSLVMFKEETLFIDEISEKDFESLAKVALKYFGNLEGIRQYDSFLIREKNEPVDYVFEAFPSITPKVEGIHRQKTYKVTMYFYKNNYEDIINDIPKHLYIHRFHDNAFDISHKKLTKGSGVKLLLNHLGIEPYEAVAIGDENSDVSMFDLVKYSIAMGNAKREIKIRANYITKTVDHHGVKFALKRLIK